MVQARRERPDVVVLGAGVAGLAAAVELARKGRRVLVLDARDRPGGRIDTRRLAGWPIPVEGGAEFEHGVIPIIDSLFRGARRHRRELQPRHFQGDGHRLAANKGQWNRATELLDALPREGRDRSYDELSREPWWRERADRSVQALARSFVEGFNAADARQVSSLWLACQNAASARVQGDRLFHLPTGYDHIVTTLVDRLRHHGGELRLGVCVRRIEWGSRRVVLEGRGALGLAVEPIRARAAVLTLPLGVLHASASEVGGVRFAPALPRGKRDAIASLRMGPVVKIVLRFHRLPAPVTRHRLDFLHVPGALVPTFWRAGADDVPVLVGWSAGPVVARLPGDERSRLRVAVDALARGLSMSRSTLAADLEGWQIIDWQADPFSRGAYSYVPAGALEAPSRLAAPMDDTLFFAGEATNLAAAGTVHGAIESGLRAARELSSALRA